MNELKLKLLSATKILEKLHVPELQADVYIKRMNGLERDIFQAAQAQAAEDEKTKGISAFIPLQSLVVAMTLCDERGDLVFDNAKEVGDLDGIVIQRLSTKALEVNGMTQASRDAIEKKALSTTTSGTI